MSHSRLPMPACIAGIASILFASAVCAQTPAPDTAKSTPSRPAAATSPSTGSSAMGSNNATAKATADSVSSGDRKFMEKAAQGGMAEVELGKLAADKAASADVKQFGQRMVDDHSKANDKLKSLATAKGVNLPTGLDRSTQREMDKLSKLSGADFDREYMKHMVSDHKKDVSEFRSEAKKAKDADLKSFAASTLPTLEEHLKLAQAAEQTAKQEGKSAGKAPSRAAAKTRS